MTNMQLGKGDFLIIYACITVTSFKKTASEI